MTPEIKEYVSMMEHTLRRRMDNQQGKEELINEYTDNMEKGLLAIDKIEHLQKDVKRFMELYNMNPDFRTDTQWMEFEQLKDKLSKVGKEVMIEAVNGIINTIIAKIRNSK